MQKATEINEARLHKGKEQADWLAKEAVPEYDKNGLQQYMNQIKQATVNLVEQANMITLLGHNFSFESVEEVAGTARSCKLKARIRHNFRRSSSFQGWACEKCGMLKRGGPLIKQMQPAAKLLRTSPAPFTGHTLLGRRMWTATIAPCGSV